jgi:aspartyl-tRNA(Asn)/glutamyl-tRNA(Gln) amidotransferase subunit A
MMAASWLHMTACELGRGIGAGKINPVDLTECFLDAIGGHPSAGRIYTRTTPRRARSMAVAAAGRQKAGMRIGLLDGVPVSWKDNIDAAGAPTEGGSALLKGRVPVADAAVLAAATHRGLVCLGKTHLSELAFSGLGLNPVTATPPCVNDDRAVPGGSSSGAAASVAFGLAPAAIGTDTGGSVRIPAAWNDLVGLKTTAGRLPLDGVLPLAARFDTVGPIAHDVTDCAELLAAMEGGRAVDLGGATVAGARLMVLETAALDDIRDRPSVGFEAAVDRLAHKGARIDRVRAPEVAEALSLAALLVTSEAWATWRTAIMARPEVMFPRILDRFQSGGAYSAADYVQGWVALNDARRAWAARTAGYDAVLLPTSAILPPEVKRLLTDQDYYVTENLLGLRNTRIGNLMGGCAITLPTGQPSCGISLMAPPMGEERLLRLASAVERALG